MFAPGGAAGGEVTGRCAANGDQAQGRTTKRRQADRHAADRDGAQCDTAHRKDPACSTTHGEDPARAAAKREDTRDAAAECHQALGSVPDGQYVGVPEGSPVDGSGPKATSTSGQPRTAVLDRRRTARRCRVVG